LTSGILGTLSLSLYTIVLLIDLVFIASESESSKELPESVLVRNKFELLLSVSIIPFSCQSFLRVEGESKLDIWKIDPRFAPASINIDSISGVNTILHVYCQIGNYFSDRM
jgi:hypothetical protein